MSYSVVVALAKPSQVQRIEIDTYLHNFNSFKFACIYSCNQNALSEEQLIDALPKWLFTVASGQSKHVDDKNIQQVEAYI